MTRRRPAGSSARTRALALAVGLALVAIAAACGDDEARPPDAGADADAAQADAPLAPCGLEEPGTRCASSTVLERCDGTAIEEVDCGAIGALCGPDPARPQDGEACIEDGDPCGLIDFQGACAGVVLAYCGTQSGTLRVADCGDSWSICAWAGPSIGYDCTTECALKNLTAEGECKGAGAIERCVFRDGAYVIEEHACPAGTSCQLVDETGWPGCLPEPACAGIGPAGRCGGDTLTRCVGGVLQSTNCAAAGKVCAYGGDLAGYVCADPGATGAFAVWGVVRYEDRVPGPGGLGPRLPAPARGVAVAVIADADGAVLAAAVTSDDGSYMLRYDAPAGAQVHVLAATTSHLAARPVRVIRPDGLVHGFAGPSFAAASTVHDLLVTDFSGLAPAFNVFDQLVVGMDFVTANLGVAAPEPLFAQWIRGTTDGTYYWDAPNGMFLLGEPADDDGYDDAVILHEMGHYIEDAYGRSHSDGGPHDGTPTDPRLAWSEGFASYFSLAVRGDSIYVDTNAGGAGIWIDYDETVTMTPVPTGPMTQNVSEDMVAEILWDAADGPAGDDDALVAGHAAVLAVETGYLRSSSGPRGVIGVDLVDWLDGWFVLHDLGACAGLKGIVTTARKFPYDWAGPGGTCPP